MGDAFQVVMPLEDTPSVYAIQPSQGVTNTAQAMPGTDFLTYLISQIQATMQLSPAQETQETVPFELPQVALDSEEMMAKLEQEKSLFGFINGTIPFVVIPGMENELYQGAQMFGAENAEQTAHLMEEIAAQLQLGEGPFKGGAESDPLSNLKLFQIDTAALRNESFAPLSVDVPEQYVDTIPRFLFDEYFSADPQGNKQQMILHQFMDQQTAQQMIKEGGPMSQALFAENATAVTREFAAEFDLTKVEEVEKHFTEKMEFSEEQNELFSSENLVLESNLSAENLFFAQAPVKEAFFKAPVQDGVSLLQSLESHETSEAQRVVDQQVEAALDLDSEFHSDARGDNQPTEHANNAPNASETVRFEQTENQPQFAVPADERIQKAKEAQMISQQIARSAHFRQGVESSEFIMTLEPDYLGQLKMKIFSSDETVSARIITDTVYTKDLLLNNISTLKESLSSSGIKISDIEITVEESGTGFDLNAQDSGNGLEARTSSNKSSTEDFAFPSYQDLAQENDHEEYASLKPITPGIRFDSGIYSVNFLA